MTSETATTPVAAPQPAAPGRLHRAARAAGAWPLRPGRLLVAVTLLALIGLGVVWGGRSLWALYDLHEGWKAVNRYHSTEALAHLRSCLAVWPDSPDALLLAARAARRKGQFDEAKQYLERYQAVAGLQDDLVLEQSLLRAQRGDIDGVSKYFMVRVERHDPATPLLLEARAVGALRGFRLRDAEASIIKWLEIDPNNPEAFYLQGRLAEALDNRLGGAESYRRSVEIDPEQDAARLRLAALLLELGQYPEALPHLEYLRHRQPDNVEVVLNLAVCKDQLGEGDEAMRLLNEALAKQPRFPEALVERGKLHVRALRWAEAEADLREAVRLQPSNTVAQENLSTVLRQNGKPQEAQQIQEHIKAIQADNVRIKDIMRREMQLDPHNPNLMCEAGQICLRQGEVEAALRWFDHAVEEDPNHKATHEALAQYYQVIGEIGRAERHRRMAGSPSRGAPEARPAPSASAPPTSTGRGER
jgi:tetratricopeptide (TPR) repeat protein